MKDEGLTSNLIWKDGFEHFALFHLVFASHDEGVSLDSDYNSCSLDCLNDKETDEQWQFRSHVIIG